MCLQCEDDGRKTATVMKKHPIWVCAALGVGIALIVVACTITPKHGPGVSIHETYVEIYPGTQISSDDQKALDAILKNFNKSLYKIRTYDRGKLVKTQGSLADARIDQTLIAAVSEASQKGVSHWTLQFGNPPPIKIGVPNQTHSAVHPRGSPTLPSPVPSTNEYRDSERLVSHVTPILQKYSSQPALH